MSINPLTLRGAGLSYGLTPQLPPELQPRRKQEEAAAPPGMDPRARNAGLAAALSNTPRVEGNSWVEALAAALTGGLRGRTEMDQRQQELAQQTRTQKVEDGRQASIADALTAYQSADPNDPQAQLSALVGALSRGDAQDAMPLIQSDVSGRLGQNRERDQYAWQRNYDNEHPEAITPYQQETLRVQRAQVDASANRRTQLTPQERRQWQNSYNDDVQQTLTGLGNLRTSIPYAGTVIRNGGHVEGTPGVNFRLNDQALLRAAARAQTGPGVLTESEVFGTLSPSLQQDLIRGRAYADITQSGIRPEDRLALARFVQLGADNASRDLWRRYEGADATLSGMGHTTAEVGIAAPEFVHPDDLRSFQSVPESALRQGQNYTAPSGRRYTYMGNGQFRFLDYHEYNPANRVRAQAPSAPTPGQVQDGYRFRGGDPANRANWERVGQ